MPMWLTCNHLRFRLRTVPPRVLGRSLAGGPQDGSTP